MKDITEEALSEAHGEDPYEYIVLSAPTVDVTNLDTSNIHPSDNIEHFKEEVSKSCANMMKIAENAINKDNVKKVVILEHPPRFDTEDQDPLSLKPKLAKLANNFYQQLWFDSKFKHKIVLGQHNLECDEKTRTERYTDRKKNKYDGVHMYSPAGRNAYTDSVLSVLSKALSPQGPRLRPNSSNDHLNCAQTKYMNAQKARSNTQYHSVPLQNRFNVLGN